MSRKGAYAPDNVSYRSSQQAKKRYRLPDNVFLFSSPDTEKVIVIACHNNVLFCGSDSVIYLFYDTIKVLFNHGSNPLFEIHNPG